MCFRKLVGKMDPIAKKLYYITLSTTALTIMLAYVGLQLDYAIQPRMPVRLLEADDETAFGNLHYSWTEKPFTSLEVNVGNAGCQVPR